ncbi:hypothetical protein [Chitinophaga vietnamensis]|uniref:hypothetical protein n=1 Tax=Chitinophaga vietnamensis TaxID=2593957 RepID=UPI001177549A|nr:hypothetical protein [Chitinophaga vietnamensis]
MFKNLLLICAIPCLLWSCGNRAGKDKTTAAGDIPATSATPIDTVTLGNKTFFVYNIDSVTFEKYPQPAMLDSSEQDALKKDSTVKRNGEKLSFRLANGKELTLTNNTSDEEGFTSYSYIANLPQIKRKGVYVTYNESNDFLLVNPDNGDTLHTWSAPILSPDKKYLLCASLDLVAAFVPNGFQLFSLDNGKITYVGEENLEDWGPSSVKWVNDKTILCEYITINEDGNTQANYVKLVMQ